MATHPYWMSSAQWADSMEQGGIFATDGSSGWSTANRVFVKYWCAMQQCACKCMLCV
jgi:hypothetical protein